MAKVPSTMKDPEPAAGRRRPPAEQLGVGQVPVVRDPLIADLLDGNDRAHRARLLREDRFDGRR